MKHIIPLLLVIAPYASSDAAEFRFAKIFTDHMVLQREMPAPVWGWAEPNAEIAVTFAGRKRTATADASGKWLVRLDSMNASTESRELTISCADDVVTLKDVLVGVVWLASGQSNMGFTVQKSTHADEARRRVPHRHLRRLKVGPYIADKPVADIGADGALMNARIVDAYLKSHQRPRNLGKFIPCLIFSCRIHFR